MEVIIKLFRLCRIILKRPKEISVYGAQFLISTDFSDPKDKASLHQF